MDFSLTKEGRLVVFHLKDTRLDAVNAGEVKAEILHLTQEEIDVMIMDLSLVTFCDSTGLGALLLAERQLRERDGGVIVVDSNGKVRSLIDLAKLTDILPVCSSVDEARTLIEE